MPRTVESIVACHEAARSLRARGRSIWPYQLNLKDRWKALDECELEGEALAKALIEFSGFVAEQMRSRLPAEWFDCTHSEHDPDVEELQENFAGLVPSEFEGMDQEEMYEVVNGLMDQLYDLGDSRRIWVGVF